MSLTCLCSTIFAQPSPKMINVMISPDHADWLYKSGEQVIFNVQVLRSNEPVKDVTVDYEIGPECFPENIKKDVVLKDGKISLKSSMKVPGFLRCKVTAKYEGRSYDGMATVGVDVDKIQPTTGEPEDFDAFWKKALDEAAKVPFSPEMKLLPEKCTSTQNVYEVSFHNDSPWSKIYGILIMPKKAGKYPAVLQVPGAGIHHFEGYNLGDKIITLEIGIHGIDVTLPQKFYDDLNSSSMNNYPWVNKNDKDRYFYKRVYVGCSRAIDFLASLPEVDADCIGVTGGSQGGGLSLVTAGLNKKVKFVALYYPALCDHSGYLHKRAGGWPHYFRNTEPKPGEVETLEYFDAVNFARRITVPGWYSWGFNDLSCPPTSTYSAYNVITAPKELHTYVENGHWYYPEQEAKRQAWLKEKCNVADGQ